MSPLLCGPFIGSDDFSDFIGQFGWCIGSFQSSFGCCGIFLLAGYFYCRFHVFYGDIVAVFHTQHFSFAVHFVVVSGNYCICLDISFYFCGIVIGDLWTLGKGNHVMVIFYLHIVYFLCGMSTDGFLGSCHGGRIKIAFAGSSVRCVGVFFGYGIRGSSRKDGNLCIVLIIWFLYYKYIWNNLDHEMIVW